MIGSIAFLLVCPKRPKSTHSDFYAKCNTAGGLMKILPIMVSVACLGLAGCVTTDTVMSAMPQGSVLLFNSHPPQIPSGWQGWLPCKFASTATFLRVSNITFPPKNNSAPSDEAGAPYQGATFMQVFTTGPAENDTNWHVSGNNMPAPQATGIHHEHDVKIIIPAGQAAPPAQNLSCIEKISP